MVLGRSGEVLGGVGWCVVDCCVALGGLGEVLGGFWRPDRFAGCTTVEAQGLPRGVRGAESPKRVPRGLSGRQKASPRELQKKHRDFLKM